MGHFLNTSYKHLKIVTASLLICVFGVSVHAQTLGALYSVQESNDKAELVIEKGASLKQVLKSMEEYYNVGLLYKTSTVEGILVNRAAILPYNNIEEALKVVLSGAELQFKSLNPKTYGIYSSDENFLNDSILQTIRGTVTDSETGELLVGVNVIAEGSQQLTGSIIGTTTDIDGSYEIEVPDDLTTLRFTFIGYQTQQIEINNRLEIDIELAPDIQLMDDVVVVGYETVRRSDLTGAVTQINSSDFERVPATSPLESLQGRSSGLQIVPNSGEPGASASIRIRGEQSISGSNSPIFVVDGSITTNIDNINSQDIESVTVLKDASAVAIYGSRAANGVIVINTKRGQANAAPSITFHTYTGIQQEGNLGLKLLNADEFLEIYTESYQNSGITPPWTSDDLAVYQGVDTDWLDIITDTGYKSNYDISVSGGSDKSNYFVSANHITHNGMVKGLDFNRTNVRINTDHQVADWVKFGNSFNVFSAKTNGDAGQYTAAIQKVPLTRAYEDDGSYGRIRNTQLEHVHASPLFDATQVRERLDKGILGNLYMTLSPLEGVEFTVRGNVEYTNQYDTDFDRAVDPSLGWEGSTLNALSKYNEETLYWSNDYLLNFNRTIGGVHNLSGLLGYSIEEQTSEYLSGAGDGTPNDEIRFLDGADPTTRRNSNGMSDWAFESMFGRLGYTFNDKYILSFTIRRDGTSRLDESNRFGVFPSVSAAWRISSEKFMSDIDWLNELKLRGSWGTTGNILSISTYGTKAKLVSWNAVFNEQQAQGFTLSEAVNTDLMWESTEKKNIGLDFELFNNRLYATADFFIENTYDLLFTQPIPYSTGLTGSPYINAGEIRNTGFEVDLGYRHVVGDWRYSLRVNFTHLKNEVIDLEGRDLLTSGIVEGYPLESFYGYKSNGLIRTQEDLDNYPHYPGKQIGDIWLVDTNGDGVVNANDRIIVGNDYPDFSYGLMGTVGYKNFTLQVHLQGLEGAVKDIRGGTNLGALHYFTQWAKNHDRLILDRFHSQKNPDGNYPRVTADDAGNNLEFSDFWLSDSSYLRISNVNVNYDFSNSFNQRFGIRDLAVYVSVQNLYTFTDFYGPEVNSNADVLTGVPQPRTWTFGLRLGI